jgi:flavin-dependent dehydrogenase
MRGTRQVRCEVAIVGGGLAGSAAAIVLARAGRNVLVIERAALPQHKVCGEFLSQEALTYLRALGVDAVALGAVQIESVRLAGREGESKARLPFAAMSLTRRKLDEELLCVAKKAGARILRGTSVKTIERAEDGWSVAIDDAESLIAEQVFLATGKHDLRGRVRPKGKQADLVAFKMYWKLAPQQASELEGHVELMLYRGGYAGLQPVEEGAANLCCLIQRTELQRLGGHWEDLLAAMLRDGGLLRQRLQDATRLLEKPLAIAAIPYGYVRASSDGVWALGDQAAVIPSFTGDGMSIALHSGFATVVSRGLVWRPARSVVSALVNAWPGVLEVVARRTRLSAEVPHTIQE